MSRALPDVTGCREALARLPELALSELRQQWRALYKSEASPHLSRELLLRAVANRMQEVALGGLRPERQRQLRQIAQHFNQTGEIRRRTRVELKSGTRLVREWQGRTYPSPRLGVVETTVGRQAGSASTRRTAVPTMVCQ